MFAVPRFNRRRPKDAAEIERELLSHEQEYRGSLLISGLGDAILLGVIFWLIVATWALCWLSDL
jgi:hypothetical protein